MTYGRERLRVTSARTELGRISPKLGLATSTIRNVAIGRAIRAHPPNTVRPLSPRAGFMRGIVSSISYMTEWVRCVRWVEWMRWVRWVSGVGGVSGWSEWVVVVKDMASIVVKGISHASIFT